MITVKSIRQTSPFPASYKQYLIVENMHGFHVSKGGFHITTQMSLAAAKAAIDLLVWA